MALETEREVAFHEAGHSVVHVLNGIRFRDVTIVPSDEYLGAVRDFEVDWGDEWTRPQWETMLVGLLAGDAACQLEFNSTADWDGGAEQDKDHALDLLYSETGSVENAEQGFEQAFNSATKLLNEHYAALVRVAEALLERKTLTYAEVVALVDED